MLFMFDWDGTLCDSTGRIVESMLRAADDMDLPAISEASVLNIIGLGLPEAIRTLFPRIADDEVEHLKASYSKHYSELDRNPSQLFDGVEQTLHRLRDDGYTLAIATGKSRRGLDRVLTGLSMQNFFHGSRCADETLSKPHPLMLHELLQQFAKGADEAVMVGDTEYDMEMARNADMDRVAVSYGAHHLDRLQAYDPSLCLHHFSDILQVLESKGGSSRS